MFKLIKKTLGLKDLQDEIVKEIDNQKEILKKTLEISATDEANIIIKEATLTQGLSNIQALAISLNQYMTKFHNTKLSWGGIERYLKKELPIECSGFVYDTDVKIHGYKQDKLGSYYTSKGLKYQTEPDLLKFYDYIDFWKGSKFNKKFGKVYVDKVRQKAIDLLREADESCADFIEHNWDSHDRYQTEFLITLVEHVEFYYIIQNLGGRRDHEKLNILLMSYQRDALAIEMVKHSKNFKAIVFATKGDYDG